MSDSVGESCANCGQMLTNQTSWATARQSFCFEDECQKAFYREAQSMIRLVNAAMADAMQEGMNDV